MEDGSISGIGWKEEREGKFRAIRQGGNTANSYLVHQLPVSNHPKTGTILKRILRGWRTAQGFAPGDKGNYKVPDPD